MKMLKILISKNIFSPFVRFTLVGGTSALLHYVIYYGLLKCQLSPNISYGIGYFLSFIYNYLLTTIFTFKVERSWGKFLKFSLGHLLNYGVQFVLFNLFMYLGLRNEWIPIPVYAISVPFNYVVLRHLLTKSRKANDPSNDEK